MIRAMAGTSRGASGGLPTWMLWSRTIPSTLSTTWALYPNSTGLPNRPLAIGRASGSCSDTILVAPAGVSPDSRVRVWAATRSTNSARACSSVTAAQAAPVAARPLRRKARRALRTTARASSTATSARSAISPLMAYTSAWASSVRRRNVGWVGHVGLHHGGVGPHLAQPHDLGLGRLGQQGLVEGLDGARPTAFGDLHQRRRMRHPLTQADPAEPPPRQAVAHFPAQGLEPEAVTELQPHHPHIRLDRDRRPTHLGIKELAVRGEEPLIIEQPIDRLELGGHRPALGGQELLPHGGSIVDGPEHDGLDSLWQNGFCRGWGHRLNTRPKTRAPSTREHAGQRLFSVRLFRGEVARSGRRPFAAVPTRRGRPRSVGGLVGCLGP